MTDIATITTAISLYAAMHPRPSHVTQRQAAAGREVLCVPGCNQRRQRILWLDQEKPGPHKSSRHGCASHYAKQAGPAWLVCWVGAAA